jgi:hypothetical protein
MDPISRQPDVGPADLPRFAEALRRLDEAPIETPADVDEAIHTSIAAHFASHRRKSKRWFFAAGGALAAVLGISVVLRSSWNTAPVPQVQIAGDLDANGRVNILDAYLLARELNRGGSAVASADVSGDGRVDAADVQAIASVAVSISTPSAIGGQG